MILHEFRQALRRLSRNAGFSLTVIALLGLAFGATAAVSSVIYGLLYKPLPYPQDERLVSVETHMLGFPFNAGLSVPFLDTIAAHAKTLGGIAAYRTANLPLRDEAGRRTASLDVARAQPALFGLLGARPALGRLLDDDDAAQGASRSLVISWEEWQQRYAGSADVIGKIVKLDADEWHIVGVMPRGFSFPSRETRAWLPLGFSAGERAASHAGNFDGLLAIARLRDDTTAVAAGSDVNGLIRTLPTLRDAFGRDSRFHAEAKPLRELWVGDRREALLLMLLAAAMVWLVTAANVANLFLARALSRRQESALTAALGAAPWRRARQTVADAAVLCIAGALCGVLLLPLGLALLSHFDLLPAGTPQAIGIDAPTLALVAVLAAALTLTLSLAATSMQQGNLHDMLRRGGTRHTAGGAAQTIRKTLIVVQISLAVALLFGVGVLLRSSQRLLAEDVGFQRDHLVYANVESLVPGDAGAAERQARLRELVERARALPGVVSVGLGSMVPFGDSTSISNFTPPGQEGITPQPTGYEEDVDEGYFAALGTQVLRGRAFTADEAHHHAAVAIVDEQFVQRYLGDADPIGRHFTIGVDSDTPDRELTIVGVVPALKQHALDEGTDRIAIYQPSAAPDHAALLLRTSVDPATLFAPLKTLVGEIAPDGSAGPIVSMNKRIADTLQDRDRLDSLLGLLGATALVLAAVGLYAVLAYSVRLRMPEFGVRMALGANAANVLRHVLAQGLLLIGAGLVLGLPLAYLFARLLSAKLYRIGPFDLPALTAVAATLGVIGLAACWLPARRAARVDPIVALRDE